MGKYITPHTMSPEQFLASYGQEINVGEFLRSTYTEQNIMQRMNCVLADNGNNKVAIILVDDIEHQRVKRSIPTDPRPKKYYSVPISKLEPYL